MLESNNMVNEPDKPDVSLKTEIDYQRVDHNLEEDEKPKAQLEEGERKAEETKGNKTLEEKITLLENENAELKDRYLRKYAEFENYKKRVQREREEMSKFSNSMLLLDIVGIIDNFERALKSAQETKDFGALHSGISMIEKQLISVLEKKWGLLRFSETGIVFDPEKHEAILAEESSEVKDPIVSEVYQNGYLIHGKVLRPAKVKVIKPSGNQKEPEQTENNK